MSELTGVDWLQSRQKQRYERRVLAPFLPAMLAATGAGALAVRAIEGSPVISHEPRSLIPEEVYTISKLGRPGEDTPVSDILAKTMLDELPQLWAIIRGTAHLVGPRGTLPDHRLKLFDYLDDGKKVDRWRHILSLQTHGLLSTYSIVVHQRPYDVTSLQDELQLSPAELADQALVRFESDNEDFINASRRHNRVLQSKFVQLVVGKLSSGAPSYAT